MSFTSRLLILSWMGALFALCGCGDDSSGPARGLPSPTWTELGRYSFPVSNAVEARFDGQTFQFVDFLEGAESHYIALGERERRVPLGTLTDVSLARRGLGGAARLDDGRVIWFDGTGVSDTGITAAEADTHCLVADNAANASFWIVQPGDSGPVVNKVQQDGETWAISQTLDFPHQKQRPGRCMLIARDTALYVAGAVESGTSVDASEDLVLARLAPSGSAFGDPDPRGTYDDFVTHIDLVGETEQVLIINFCIQNDGVFGEGDEECRQNTPERDVWTDYDAGAASLQCLPDFKGGEYLGVDLDAYKVTGARLAVDEACQTPIAFTSSDGTSENFAAVALFSEDQTLRVLVPPTE